MNSAAPPPMPIGGRNIIVAGEYRRPPEARPVNETLEGLTSWLTGEARKNPSFTQIVDEFAWRLIAAGVPLMRVSLHGGTLHPLYLGATYLWSREHGVTQKLLITHEVTELIPYERNPVRRVREGGETLRRRLDLPEAEFDFTVLRDLKEQGGAEYLALPIPSPFGFGSYMAAFVTTRPSGFADLETSVLTTLASRLSVIADMNSQRQIANNVLGAYLGPRTGPRVLAGHIRRGSGEAITAVMWSSDLRGFTHFSDHSPGDVVIETLNLLFDLQAKRIGAQGGEILKFIGDGLLAIFPIETPEDAPRVAANALAAARAALRDLEALNAGRAPEAPFRLVVAMHLGDVIYGNIGSAERLDFTVIGPAVNLVSRIEAVAKSRDLPLVVSDDFARALSESLPSLGAHRLRGLERPHELFAPDV